MNEARTNESYLIIENVDSSVEHSETDARSPLRTDGSRRLSISRDMSDVASLRQLEHQHRLDDFERRYVHGGERYTDALEWWLGAGLK